MSDAMTTCEIDLAHGRHLKALLQRHGKTQSDLAWIIDQKKSHVSRLLNGERRLLLHHVIDVARALDLPPSCVVPKDSPLQAQLSTVLDLERGTVLLEARDQPEKLRLQELCDLEHDIDALRQRVRTAIGRRVDGRAFVPANEQTAPEDYLLRPDASRRDEESEDLAGFGFDD